MSITTSRSGFSSPLFKAACCVLALMVPGLGCGTINNLGGGNLFISGPKIYGGIQQDAVTMKEGGRHEPYSVIFSCLDMPFSFVLDTVLLPVTVPIVLLSDDSPETELRRIQDRLLQADSLSIEFDAETRSDPPLHVNGRLLLKKDGKVRLELRVPEGDGTWRRTMVYVSDGKIARGSVNGVLQGAHPAPARLELAYRELVVRGGFFDNPWLPPGDWKTLLSRAEPPEMSTGGKSAQAAQIPAYLLEKATWASRTGFERILNYDLSSEGNVPDKVTLRFEPGTFRLRDRTIHSHTEGHLVTEERFTNFRLNVEIPDDQFAVPR